MEASTPAIDIPAFIDANALSRFQIGILVSLGMAVMIDGFNAQAIGFVAPTIIRQWGVGEAGLGGVFGAGLGGMLIGTLVLSAVADKIGGRLVLIGATTFVSLCMVATAWTTSIAELEVIRFVTGLGLGGIMPCALALASAYSPKRHRVTMTMLVCCGFAVGAMLGGLLSAAIIPGFGWHSVFYIGATVSLLVTALMGRYVPESMQFMTLQGRKSDVIAQHLQRIAPDVSVDANLRYVASGDERSRVLVRQLFRDGRTAVTVLLWGLSFMNCLNGFFLMNWLPTIAASTGLTTSVAVLMGTAFQASGVLGTVLMGLIIDRIGFLRLLVPSFVVAAFAVAAIGQSGVVPPVSFVVVSVAGFCIVGGQLAVNALAAISYPTTLRSTGVGWSLGSGRIGAIAGPVLGGELISRGWSTGNLFLVAAAPAVISAVLLLAMAAYGSKSGPAVKDASKH